MSGLDIIIVISCFVFGVFVVFDKVKDKKKDNTRKCECKCKACLGGVIKEVCKKNKR